MIDKILEEIERQADNNSQLYNCNRDEWYLVVRDGLLKAKEIILAAQKESKKDPSINSFDTYW